MDHKERAYGRSATSHKPESKATDGAAEASYREATPTDRGAAAMRGDDFVAALEETSSFDGAAKEISMTEEFGCAQAADAIIEGEKSKSEARKAVKHTAPARKITNPTLPEREAKATMLDAKESREMIEKQTAQETEAELVGKAALDAKAELEPAEKNDGQEELPNALESVGKSALDAKAELEPAEKNDGQEELPNALESVGKSALDAKAEPETVEKNDGQEERSNMPQNPAKSACVSKIGGQAVIEGVMMRGVTAQAMCVRAESGEKLLTSERLKPPSKASRIPIVRGIVNFVSMLIMGMKVLMKSADAFGTDEEEMPKSALYGSVILGILLAVGLFIFLPSLLSDALFGAIGVTKSDGLYTLYKALFEGLLRIVIFIAYLLLTSLLKDIRRTYMYHGAEHKTINCYEHGLPLTVENVAKSSKVHNRCGTTFMFLVLTISILMFALANWLVAGVFGWPDRWWVNLLVRLVLLPLVAGISYEVLKGLAYLPDNLFTKIIRAPGLSLQSITTKQPTTDMIECAIAAFEEVQALDADAVRGTVDYVTIKFADARVRVEKVLDAISHEDCEADWIWCDVLKISRAELTAVKEIKRTEFNRAAGFAKRRVSGLPLSYVLGNAYFYGDKLKVTPAVLTPRPETELVAEQAVILLLAKESPRALDLCTGSGCIAYVLAKYAHASVVAADLSEHALRVAAENCKGLDVEIVKSDLFDGIEGEFDVIVSNPPYIPTEDLANLEPEVRKEPAKALDGGADGLYFYRQIAKNCAFALKPDGAVVLELGIGQADAVKKMFAGWDVTVLKDYGGIDRILIAKPNKESV